MSGVFDNYRNSILAALHLRKVTSHTFLTGVKNILTVIITIRKVILGVLEAGRVMARQIWMLNRNGTGVKSKIHYFFPHSRVLFPLFAPVCISFLFQFLCYQLSARILAKIYVPASLPVIIKFPIFPRLIPATKTN